MFYIAEKIYFQSQLDEDYKIFMADHKEALNRALKTCQEQSEKEKLELTTKYEDMIKVLREKQDVMNQSKEVWVKTFKAY